MPNPTVGIGFSSSIPAAPSGDQDVVAQMDNGMPLQRVSFYPRRATTTQYGTVKQVISTACVTIDGGGSTPTTGSKAYLQIPFDGTITGWTLIADVSGSASITVKKSTFAAFPTNSSIVASAPPALSSQQNATSTTLTGWTTAVTAGDVLEFVLASATTVKRLVLELQITRS
jgi:heat shock protein HslJ